MNIFKATATAMVMLLVWLNPSYALQGEKPLSQSMQKRISIERVAVRELAAVDRVALLAQDDKNAKVGTPLRFAIPEKVSLSPANSGHWTKLPNGDRVWQLRFAAAGATDLNFGFTDYRLPQGARLYIVSELDGYYQGPYTSRHNKPHRQLYTPVVPGAAAYVELFLPARIKDGDYSLQLVQVAKGYRDMFKLMGNTDATKSGPCNNDVVCPEGDMWRDEIRSVARLSNAGATLCTGQLVMDAESSFRNWFLTANHCGITAATAPLMVTYWNYESPLCGQQGGGSLDQNVSGATFVSARDDVDFTLVELDEAPMPEWNVYWSGWDNTDDPVSASVGIHHPSGDEKAISFNTDALIKVDACAAGAGVNTHWEVNNWEDGTTEGGSSGSGIWDPESHLLVGTLTGGSASCSSVTSDCYGRFGVSWDGLTPVTRLRDHLDPNNTGIEQMPGGEPVDFSLGTPDPVVGVCGAGSTSATIDVIAEGAFSDPVTLAVTGVPAGVSAGFVPNPVTPPGASVMTLTVTTPTTGSFPLEITGSTGSGDRMLEILFEAAKTAPGGVDLLFPGDGATNISPQQKLYWTGANNATSYNVAIATDAAFSNIVYSAKGITAVSHIPTELLGDATSYFWRVTAKSPCGDVTSPVYSFTTSTSTCTLYESTDVPQTILPIPSDAESTVEVSGLSSPVGDVNLLGLKMTHSWVSDISVRLQSPAGTNVLAMARSCDDEENFDLNLDDQANPGDWPCPPADGGTYQPSEPFAGFVGEDGNGTWRLLVNDAAAQDGGSIDGWGVQICVAPPSQVYDGDGDNVEDDQDNCQRVANSSQCDTNNDGLGNHCDADLDDDGIVNSFDLSAMRQAFGTSTPDPFHVADLNCDGVVNSFDLSIMRGAFGAEPGPGAVAP
ncbi:MAG: proprotein convertase P-domain-containing protein [Gammaproteobacteria bacterium]|nr:proprotein convertase P-domain-containing protein [Gammaproteobacteria bacterium]